MKKRLQLRNITNINDLSRNNQFENIKDRIINCKESFDSFYSENCDIVYIEEKKLSSEKEKRVYENANLFAFYSNKRNLSKNIYITLKKDY